jgi:hypothetical protein
MDENPEEVNLDESEGISSGGFSTSQLNGANILYVFFYIVDYDYFYFFAINLS